MKLEELSEVVVRSEQRIIHLEKMFNDHSDETRRFNERVLKHDREIVEIKRDRWWLSAIFAGLWTMMIEFFKAKHG